MQKFECQKNDPQVYRLRVENEDNSFLTADQVESMKLFVFNCETQEEMTPEGGEDLVVADCILEETAWDEDEEGFNARIPVKGEYLNSLNNFQCEVKITPIDDGEPFYLEHIQYQVVETYSA